MDGINLTNDDSTEPIILSTEQLERISDFKKKVETDGLISKKDVLSIEEFLGVNIITSKINSKKLTMHPTTTMFEETIEVVEPYVNDYQPVTNHMLLTSAKHILYLLRELKYRLVGLADIYNNDFYDKAMSDEYALYMVDDNIINLTDISLSKLCKNNFMYLQSITDSDKAEYLVKAFEDESIIPTGLMVMLNESGLENVYYKPKLSTVTDVTMRKVITTLRHGSAIPGLTKLIDIIDSDVRNLVNGNSWDVYTGNDLTLTYKRYTNMNELLFDNLSMATLTFLRNVKKD